MPREPKTLSCDFKDCTVRKSEDFWGSGFPGWGGLMGIMWDNKEVMLCPDHLISVCKLIKGE